MEGWGGGGGGGNNTNTAEVTRRTLHFGAHKAKRNVPYVLPIEVQELYVTTVTRFVKLKA